jgi:uncharacterized protein DUF3501
MNPLQFHDILSVDEYTTQRDRIRPSMMALKARRRLHLGEHMTLHFENRDTVFYQVQEMIRAEHITAKEAILHELETYNQLVPGPDELSATLMVEYSTAEERARELPKLLGLDRCLFLVIGDRPPCLAEFDRRQFDEDRLSSVQFVRFRLGPDDVAALRAEPSPPVLLRVEHPQYQADAFVPRGLLEELKQDLVR